MGVVEFSRRVGEKLFQCGNQVQLADANGTAYSAANPLPTTVPVPPEVPTAISGTVSAVGPTVLVAAPVATRRIVVLAFVVQNEAATANTMQVHFGGAANGFRCFGQNQGDGLSVTFALGRGWRGAAGTALSMTNTAASVVGYSVLYFTETV